MAENLTEEYRAEMKEAFALFDKDGDGKITVEEIKAVIISMGQTPSDEEAQEMMQNMDKDGNGTVEFEEFLEMMSKRGSSDETVEAEMKEAFEIFDKDKNGYITRDELQDVMKSLGEELSQEQLDEMMRECDLNGDNKVSFKEFVKMMKGDVK